MPRMLKVSFISNFRILGELDKRFVSSFKKFKFQYTTKQEYLYSSLFIRHKSIMLDSSAILNKSSEIMM